MCVCLSLLPYTGLIWKDFFLTSFSEVHNVLSKFFHILKGPLISTVSVEFMN